MKKVLIGLIIGFLIAGAAGFIVIPGIKQTAYDAGFQDGNKKGVADGTRAGIVQGIADIKAIQKHQQDSVAQVRRNEEEQRKAAARRAKKPAPVVQNWHVIDGKISEPVVPEKTSAKAPSVNND